MSYTGDGTAGMWGPNGWDKDVSVHQFTAVFSDEQTVSLLCDMAVGSVEQCTQYGQLFNEALGRVPSYARGGTQGLHMRPGGWSGVSNPDEQLNIVLMPGDDNVAGCAAWGGGGVITLCVGVGTDVQEKGNLEELFLHEGAHVTLDPYILHTDTWGCAMDEDQDFISDYAKEHPGTEDVSESIVPWHAWYYSQHRVDPDIIGKISATIPARLEVLVEFLTSETLRQDIADIVKNLKSEIQTEPHVIYNDPLSL